MKGIGRCLGDVDIRDMTTPGLITTGMRMISYGGAFIKGHVTQLVNKDNEVEERSSIVSTCKGLDMIVKNTVIPKLEVDPCRGPKVWSGFNLKVTRGIELDFVKGAYMNRLEDLYTYENIPRVFDAINRMQETTFRVNKWLLDLSKDDKFIFNIQNDLDEDEYIDARNALAYMRRKARITNTLANLEKSAWYSDMIGVIAAKSKVDEVFNIHQRADKWKDKPLNFTYTLDSRGRMYPVQNYLQPQGSDLAKALLVFDMKQCLDYDALAVTTANHAGVDKLSFKDRIAWFEEHKEDIIKIGDDPVKHQKLLIDWDIIEEDKSRWQFVACCREWFNISLWELAGLDLADYRTDIVCARDCSCSALQIATVISRDHNMAPHVNVVKTDKPGDIYKVTGDELLVRMNKIPEDQITEGLQQVLDHSSIRKVAKRPQMVSDYSGTKFGMGAMTYEDRKKNKVNKVNMQDAILVGGLLYDISNDPSRGSTKIKNFLRSGIDLYNGGPLMRWRTLDGFPCFQEADKVKMNSCKAVIGGVEIRVTIYSGKGVCNKARHKNMVCPNITHSIDATIVRLLALGLPKDAPIAMVHDSFGTSSSHVKHLLPLTLDAFEAIGNREWYETMIANMIGTHRSLPAPGKLTMKQIKEATYAIS